MIERWEMIGKFQGGISGIGKIPKKFADGVEGRKMLLEKTARLYDITEKG